MIKYFVLAAALLAFLSIEMSAQNYSVDASSSSLKWFGEKVLGKHNGSVNIKDGTMTKSGKSFSGNFSIDMTSITNEDLKDAEYNAKLIGHLKSDDFFSVAKHNTATFKLKNIKDYTPKKGEQGKHWVTGDLTIKGITNEIAFPANITFTDKGFNADAKFSIDRTKWDIRYGSGSFFDNLGDKTIYDEIKFNLSLVGKKQ